MRCKSKFAYPNERYGNILLSETRKHLRPAFDDEIEIISIKNNILKGNLVHFENTAISPIEEDEVRDEDFEMRKRYGFFGELIPKIKKGWIRLKLTSYVEIELKNLVITTHFEDAQGDKK